MGRGSSLTLQVRSWNYGTIRHGGSPSQGNRQGLYTWRHHQARALLAKGINPTLDRKHKRQFVRLADEHTFKAVFLQWVEHRKLELKEGRNSTLSQILRIFERDVLPSLSKLSIYDVRRADLLNVLSKIEQREAFTTAEKVRSWLNQLFRFARVKVVVTGFSIILSLLIVYLNGEYVIPVWVQAITGLLVCASIAGALWFVITLIGFYPD